MTTYREGQGYRIKSVTSNPDNVKEGQIWYNSTESKIKVAPTIEGWASGPTINAGRPNAKGIGPTSAGLIYGGGSPNVRTEHFDGSSWTAANNMNTNRTGGSNSQAGSQTAAFASNGPLSNGTEEYDGTNWTSGGNYPFSVSVAGGAGTLTAGLGFGGYVPATPNLYRETTVEYDGSSWTSGGDLNQGRSRPRGVGTQTAALASGGFTDSDATSNHAENYNGTSWTALPNMNEARDQFGIFGNSSKAYIYGGKEDTQGGSADLNTTEEWNGSSWAAAPTLGSAITQNAGLGVAGSGYSIGGSPNVTATELFSDIVTTRSVDVS
jgi:hypothetical protein|tara:strand:+ start:9 stop:977 length:969 start_codon:yes stop_codon:yes gene_type:complete